MKKLILLVVACVVSSVSFSEDIELYISDTVKALSSRPQVLIILDNSGSMRTEDTVTAPYDPSVTYPAVGGLNSLSSKFIYFRKGGVDGTAMPVPDSPSESRRFLDSINSCKTAADILASNGFYTGRVREYERRGNNGTWEEIPDSNGANIEVIDCEDDVTAQNPNNIASIPQGYPVDSLGTRQNPIYHTGDVADSNVEWNGQLVTLYTDNFLRWHHNASQNQTLMSRLDQAVNSISSVIRSAPSVDFGLEIFNYNDGNSSNDPNGGRVVFGIKESTAANKTALLDIIENKLSPQTWTPLCESLYEASLYFSGKNVDFGDADENRGSYKKNKPPMDSSVVSNGKYQTPVRKCNSNVYVILITDGEPTYDSGANSKIRAFTSKDADGNTVNFSGGTYAGSYLASLAGWMQNQDINLNLDGIQKATTFTIGFSDGASSAESLLKETARQGGGEYFYADNHTQLTSALTSIFEQLEPSNESLTSASVAANNFDRTETLNAVYYAMFEPQNSPRWQGNVKKYKVLNGKQVGQGGVPALNDSTGHFSDTVTSFWSPSGAKDGVKVAEGGVAEMLRNVNSRTLYSNVGTGSSLTAFNRSNVENFYGSAATLAAELGVAEADIDSYLDWHKGIDVDDEDKDSLKNDMRYDVFADPLHSKPLVINYGNSIRILIGTNAGVLHMFEDNTSSDVVSESWAFMPNEFFNNIKALRDNFAGGDKVYGIDGNLTPYIKDANGDGIVNGNDKVWVFFGLRRGGTSYYALDVTSPSSPQLMWHIDSNTPGFSELGQSWSQPKVTHSEINTSGSGATAVASPVVIFGGGYDTAKDAKGAGLADGVGRAVYMVDAKTGSLKWSLAPSGGTTAFTGDHSIPSSIATLDSDGNGLADRLYFGDTGGDLWRVDMPSGNPQDTTEPWTFFKLASLGGNGVDNAIDRRFFNEPSIARTFISETIETQHTDANGVQSTVISRQEKPYDAVLIGSGDRSNPLGVDTQDTFFMIKDEYIRSQSFTSSSTPAKPSPILLTDLYDYTNNPFDQTMTTQQKETLEVAVSKKSGWFLNFDSISGEKSTSSASVINGVAYLTSYIPPSAASSSGVCKIPGGQGWLYAVDLALGTHVYQWTDAENPNGITDGDKRKVYISEQFLGSPTLIVVPEDDGDPNTVDDTTGNIIVGRRIIPVGFTLKTMRTNLYIEEAQ
ncbi:PilC/PilY family type IV pilus protein [Thalassotalea sp. 1_MG-2023]|uniref:pilus assembly protein n=1 Tax=Thalassotalea sp. 1_MG-2023 TaxID=3062680 RepID=UPI0026E2A66F|nr:PilC/PilY family type IV pilus protein [Thalassotalea sp. 1_MG-2023]MDO6427820.1 PilC/PilY family type IV pilus protein [Thalassotalea sp. 1_MG-2023]